MRSGAALLLLLGCAREPAPPSVVSTPDVSCLVLRTMTLPHCARGTGSCAACRAAAQAAPKPTLLNLCTDGPEARPVVELEQSGVVRRSFYEVVRVFEGEEEASRFADAAKIPWVDPKGSVGADPTGDR